MNVKDIICNGTARILGKVYASEFVGKLTGNADTATNVTGVVSVANGGTGATTAKASEYNILSGMTEDTSTVSDTTQVAFAYTNPSDTQGRLYWRKTAMLWDYIKSKTDATYAPTSHSHGSVNSIIFSSTEPTSVAEGQIVLVYEE